MKVNIWKGLGSGKPPSLNSLLWALVCSSFWRAGSHPAVLWGCCCCRSLPRHQWHLGKGIDPHHPPQQSRADPAASGRCVLRASTAGFGGRVQQSSRLEEARWAFLAGASGLATSSPGEVHINCQPSLHIRRKPCGWQASSTTGHRCSGLWWLILVPNITG